MEPTLREGDLLLVRWGAPPRVGRLAVVRLPDGRPLSVKRLAHRVPEGWWVERDNPRAGVDSWAVGPVAEVDVLAVALRRLPRWLSGLRGLRSLSFLRSLNVLRSLSGRGAAGRRRPSRRG